MGTPVHDGGDANGVRPSAAPPGESEQSMTPAEAGRTAKASRTSARASSAKPVPTPSESASAESERRSSVPKSTPAEPAESPPMAPEIGSIGEETEAPPTAPEAARRSQAAASEPPLRPSMRLPQGLGGPNIAAPSALELLRARNAIPPSTEGINLPAVTKPQFEGDVAVRALRQRLALAPEFVSPPPVRRRSMSILPSLGRVSIVLLVALTVALSVALVTMPDTRPTIFKTESGPLLASTSSTQQPAPRLIGVEGRRNFSNEAITLGVSLYGATGSELAMLTGLVSGTRLSVGNPLGDNGWRLPARDLVNALAYAPKDFVGVMNAAIDLRMPNDRVVDSRVMRLEWLPRRPDSLAARLPDREDLRTGTRPEPRPEPRPELKPEPKPETPPEGKPAAVPLTIDGAEVAALL